MSTNSKILIVEDDKHQGSILAEYLNHKGYDTKLTLSGKEALITLERSYFDLVLLDWRLPDMNGLEVLSKIKEKHPLTQIIMITAFATIERAVEAIKLGAYHYISKPVDLEELILLINRSLKELRLQQEINLLRQKLMAVGEIQFPNIVAESQKMKEILSLAQKVGKTNATVLIQGESGTGKEVIARIIHSISDRSNETLVKINCAAIPEELLESEMFGHEKGAFTGAEKAKPGLLEIAHNGTLFLDEIGDMSIKLQAKLLRFLQDGSFHRVGGLKEISVNVRIIAATNKDLEQLINGGLFREDLYWRLNVFKITVPPLRERKQDIPHLVETFIKKYAEKHNKKILGTTREVMEMLLAYNYPGNVRELENIVERAIILAEGETITIHELPPNVYHPTQTKASVTDPLSSLPLTKAVEIYEKQRILNALEQSKGIKTRAAKILGISERMLRYKMKKYGILLES